ncbi:MAG TPA: hypothetical protein VH041_11905 [Caldimonas sp.]|jgi:hypothetical protein|nr:hypothetical protein [Caldimonas sp.]HEX4234998.1 hypothetical protein [Caldimonas sp.]
MNLLSRRFLLVASLLLALAAAAARAQDIPLVTGEHWTQSSEAVKKAYLVGIANFLQVETAYGGTASAGDAQSLVPRMVKGLRGGKQTLDSVRTGLDAWYAANPGRLQRPVIEVIWFEMVVPGMAEAN